MATYIVKNGVKYKRVGPPKGHYDLETGLLTINFDPDFEEQWQEVTEDDEE
jgi:hypothetical protein